MFRSQKIISNGNNCLLLFTNKSNRQYFLSSQLLGKKCSNAHRNQLLQRQQQFGSHSSASVLLASDQQSTINNLSGCNAHQIGDYKNILLLEQKRLFAVDASSSSSSGQQQEQQIGQLAKKWLQLDDTSRLHLTLLQGKSRKFFVLTKTFVSRANSIAFLNLPLEVGYPFINAMDTLLNTLLAKHDEENNTSSCTDEHHQPSSSPPMVLESQRVNADFFDFQLELIRLGNGNAYMFKLNSIKTVHEHHREREMRLPVRALPWLRKTMAQMLTEHDDEESQQLGPEPPELPESILEARSPAAAVQNHPKSPQRSANFSGR